jgi:hypothetical protein
MNEIKPEPPEKIDSAPEIEEVKPQPEAPQPPPEPPPPAVPDKKAKPEKPPKKPPGFLVRAVRWLLLALILLGAGALLIIFTMYAPIRSELKSANQELQKASSQYINELQEAKQEIKRLSGLDEENITLQDELYQSNLYIIVLQARIDVANAQLALSEGDYSRASLALSKTSGRLEKLTSLLPSEQREVIGALQTRLDLALSEIEAGDPAAMADLGVLAMKLLELEDAIIN